MAGTTIHNFDDDAKRRLRIRSAVHYRSTREEARPILRDVVGRKPTFQNLANAIGVRVAPLGRVDLELPPRGLARESPIFD